MIDVQLMGDGPDGLLIRLGQFLTMEEAVAVANGVSCDKGQHQKISNDETGEWQVRSNGNQDWTRFDPALPRMVGWGECPAAGAMLLTD
jgi:hypothetical protein